MAAAVVAARRWRCADGIDLSQPLYVGTYGEWTKKEGLSRVDPSEAGRASRSSATTRSFDFQKAKDADVYVYTQQTSRDFPNYYVANADFKGGRQITDANPQQKEFAWTSGVQLDQLHERQGRQAAGRAVSAGELRAGQEVSAARHDLREALEPGEHAT